MNARCVMVCAVTALLTLASDATARAESNERLSMELDIGPYRPAGNAQAFSTVFGNERGPYVGLDAFVHIVRIPYVGPVGVTISAGWARYSANACIDAACTERADETDRYDLYPLAASLTLRFDALHHELRVPIFLAGSAGLEYVRFRETRGGQREAYGGAFGFRWRGQVGLFLDFLEPRRARSLDEEYGINHTYLFFELRGSLASAALPVADRFTWLGGFGLTF